MSPCADLEIEMMGSVTGLRTTRAMMLPSVGTWLVMPFPTSSKTDNIDLIELTVQVDEAELSARESAFDFFWAQVDDEEEREKSEYIASELSLRQASFDLFWAQADAEEEDEKSFYMASELYLRQAALDLFWAQLDEEEEDERAFYMAAELDARQAAFDFFWAQVDAEEEDERAFYIAAELSLRQAAFDFFWAQIDAEEEDERACYMAAELSLRQVAFDFFWAQVDTEEEDERVSYMAAELSMRQAAFESFWAQVDEEEQNAQALDVKTMAEPVQIPKVWATYSMAGSPAKSIRRAKESMSVGIGGPFTMPSCPPPRSGSLKSRRTYKPSSSTSAMAIDLGLNQEPKADYMADLLAMHSKPSAMTKMQEAMSDMKTWLPPLKKSGSSAEVWSADFAENTKKSIPMETRGC